MRGEAGRKGEVGRSASLPMPRRSRKLTRGCSRKADPPCARAIVGFRLLARAMRTRKLLIRLVNAVFLFSRLRDLRRTSVGQNE